MALASRLAGPDNAVPSLPGSDSWLSKKKQKKNRSLFLHVLVQSSYILDVVGTSDLPLTLFDCVTCAIYSRVPCTRQDSGMICDSDVIESHRGAGGAPYNSSLTLFEKVSFRATTPAPVIVRATFSWPIYLLFFLFSSSGNCLKNFATDFFYSFPTISGDETKSWYLEKHLFLYVSKYFGRLTFELWNSVATFCR